MENIENYTKIFKALSNQHRLRVFIRCLEMINVGELCFKDANEMRKCQRDLAKDMGIVPSTMSHHSKELCNAGLLKIEREGQRVISLVDPHGVALLRDFLDIVNK